MIFKIKMFRGSGTSVSSESSDGGSSRRKGNREEDYSNRKEDKRERKLHKKEDIESIDEDASKTILDDISNKGKNCMKIIYIFMKICMYGYSLN